ncbi:MAG: ribosome hibernation-promoting factor, HPF/YfiA family [Planctomycetota bacterium]
MNIRVTGRTDEVTSAMKRKAQQKVSKLLKFYDRITWVDVVLGVDKERKTAELTAGLNRGNTVVGKAKSSDTYAAIDLAIDKIARQLTKHKEKLKDHRPSRSMPPESLPEEGLDDIDEDEYED